MQRPAWIVACCLTLGSLASAQDPQTGVVSGTVYDSVGRAPLRDALVQMVPPAGTPLLTATTDARGRYSITGAPPGRYFIDFAHGVLDSLALEPPLRHVEVRAGGMARLDLAVPSPATIVTQTCRSTPSDSVGLLFGVLHDSKSRTGLDSGQVMARWFELVIDTSGLNNSERISSSKTTSAGWFAMCGVPSGVEVLVQGVRGSDSTGVTLVSVPPHGLVRFDVSIGGITSIHGRVTSQGKAVENARVRAGEDERGTYTDSAGRYRLAQLRAGSQTVEVRALGYAPQATPVALVPDSATTIDFQLTTVKRVMDTIKVVAERVYSIDRMGFERRRRSAAGTFFDSEIVRRRSPYSVSQLLYEVPSIRVLGSGFDRTFVMRGGNGVGFNACPPAFFLNGVRMPADLLSELDLFVRPQELEGMEVYRGMMVPPDFHVNGACGAVVVWTKRSPRRGR